MARRGRPPKVLVAAGAPPPTRAEKNAPPDAAKTLARWTGRATQGTALREYWERTYKVVTCEEYFLGQQGQGEHGIALNHFLATVKTIRPSLFYQVPKFFVRPRPGMRGKSAESVARIGEGVLETVARRDDNLKQAGKLAVAQAFFRVGVLKTIYDPAMVSNPQGGTPMFETTPEGEPVVDPATGQAKPLIDALTATALLEPDEILTDEVYRWDWVDAASLLLPDAGPDPAKWPWIIEAITVPLEEAKADERFDETLRAQLQANVEPQTVQATAPLTLAAPPGDESVRYYEGYDLRARRHVCWADGQTQRGLLLDEPTPAWVEDHPYAILALGDAILGPRPLPWPLPPTQSWLDPQKEYNTRRRQIMEGAKRSARKGVYDEGTFPNEEEALKFLQNPDDMAFAKVTDISRPPLVLPTPDLNPAIYRDIPLLYNDWRILTGQPGARQGQPEDSTATEAVLVERGAGLRDADMQDAVRDWLRVAGRKMLQCLKRTLTLGVWVKLRSANDTEWQDYVQRVYGIPSQAMQQFPALLHAIREQLGAERWQRITREDLEFEADVEIAPGSAKPRSLDWERRQWLQFLQLIGQFPQLALSRALLQETADKFEGISERMLDELTLLARQMVEMSARQAGRTQGGSPNGAPGAPGATPGGSLQSMLVGALSGGRGGG